MLRLGDKQVAVEDVSADTTLAIANLGYAQRLTATGKVITLPATIVGAEFLIVVGHVPPTGGPVGAGGAQACSVTLSPAAADRIDGLGATGTDNKDLLLAEADSRPGDFVRLIGTTNGWNIAETSTTSWTREA